MFVNKVFFIHGLWNMNRNGNGVDHVASSYTCVGFEFVGFFEKVITKLINSVMLYDKSKLITLKIKIKSK